MEVLEVPQFIPSVQKSSQQFGFSFAHAAPKVWNELPDDICHISFIFSEESESLCLHKSLPILSFIVFSDCLCGL